VIIRKDGTTAAAWLSSARAVGCSLKWDNERNPCPMLYMSLETAHSLSAEMLFQYFESGRKERTTSSQHGAYDLGNTHPTMAKNNGKQTGNGKQIPLKFRLSSD
jgi:hypothetical protein